MDGGSATAEDEGTRIGSRRSGDDVSVVMLENDGARRRHGRRRRVAQAVFPGAGLPRPQCSPSRPAEPFIRVTDEVAS